jgi:hypothetical protein
VLGVTATDSYPATAAFPLLGRTRVQAVTIRLDFSYLGRKSSQPDTMYFARVGDQWKGLWTRAEFSAYRHRRCPV